MWFSFFSYFWGWLGSLYHACRNLNGTNTVNKGVYETTSSPVPTPDSTPAFAAARRALAPAPVLGPASDENDEDAFWGGDGGGDKGVQEESDLAIEDLTAAFDEEGERGSNKVRAGGRGRIRNACARVTPIPYQPRYPAIKWNDASRM